VEQLKVGATQSYLPFRSWYSAPRPGPTPRPISEPSRIAFVAAFKAKDVDAIMKVYAPGQTLIVFDVIPPRQYVGAAAYRKDWQTFLGSFDGPIAMELTDLDVVADRNLAYSHSIQHVAAPTSRARSSTSRCG